MFKVDGQSGNNSHLGVTWVKPQEVNKNVTNQQTNNKHISVWKESTFVFANNVLLEYSHAH